MSKTVVALIVTAVIVIAGVGAYFYFSSDSTSTEATDVEQQANAQTDQFQPVSTENLAFTATFTSTAEDKTTVAKVDYDGNSYWRYSADQGDQQLEIITTPDAYYTLADGTWYKYPISGSGGQGGFDSSAYEYDQSEIESYRNSATYQGQDSCPAGTCDVWLVADGDGNETKIYLSTTNNYISKVETKTNETTGIIEYEYKAVSITPPANAQEIPNL